MSVLPINKNDYFMKARPAILSVYGQEYIDILSYQFWPRIERSLILMDYSGGINGNLLQAISTVAQGLGDKGFYLSYPVPAKEEEFSEHELHQHWYVPFDQALDYVKETGTFVYKYTHYSPNGIWGIVSSNDVFGVLSGTNDFVQHVLKLAPEINNDVNRFIAYWLEHKRRHNMNIDWVPSTLKNVYGENEASRFASFFNHQIFDN